jgi:hypothetical protein
MAFRLPSRSATARPLCGEQEVQVTGQVGSTDETRALRLPLPVHYVVKEEGMFLDGNADTTTVMCYDGDVFR